MKALQKIHFMKPKTKSIATLNRRVYASLLVGTSLLAQQVYAADVSELDGMTVISGSRSHITLDDTPKAITVVSSEQIDTAITTGGMQQLLAEIPGVDFARTGGLGGQLVIRGFNSNTKRTLLLIDGERFRGRSTLEFNMFDPAMIERIEVIRGAASSEYGADAMNGVVNIVTRRAKVDSKQAFSLKPKIRSTEYNSVNNSYGARAELIGGGNGFDVLLGGNFRKGDDYDTPVGKAENSAYEASSFDLKAGYSPSEHSRWELNARVSETMTERAGGYGASPGAVVKKVKEDPIDEQYLKLAYDNSEFSAWADRMQASVYVRRFDTDIFVTAGEKNTHLKVDTPTVYGGRVSFNKMKGDHLISWGGDIFSEDFGGRYLVLPNGNTKQLDRQSETLDAGFYLMDDWVINDRTQLSTAVRYDYIRTGIQKEALDGEDPALTAEFDKSRNHTENAFTGSLGLVHDLTDTWGIKANYSRAFHAADGLTRTIASSAGTIPTLPNPQLESETSDTLEFGFSYDNGNLRSSLVAYKSLYKDLIQTEILDGRDELAYQRVNVGEAQMRGLEWDALWQVNSNVRLRSALTYTHGQNKTKDQALSGIPPLNGQLALKYTPDSALWWAEFHMRASKERSRVDTNKERKRPGFATFSVTGGLDLEQAVGLKNWRLIMGVENAFDKEIRNPVVEENLNFSNDMVGNPLVEPGRSVFIKLINNY